MPGISVLIVTHNRAHLIAETIGSVLGQTHSNFELIVIDDGSIDNTEEIVRSFDDTRIQYFYFPRIGRLTTLRNLAVSKSKMEFIAFIDSDDIWGPKKLEICLNECLSKNASICVADCIEFDSTSTNVKSRGEALKKLIEIDIAKEILENNVPLTYGSNLFFNRELYDSGIKFDEDFFAGDHDFMVRAVYKSKAVYISEVLTHIRKHSANMSSDIELFVMHVLEFNQTLNKLKSENLINTKIYKRLTARNYYIIANHYQAVKLPKSSFKNLTQAIKYRIDFKALLHYAKKVIIK